MRKRRSLTLDSGRFLALRIVIAAALGVSAVIHIQLAPTYQQAAPGGIGQGTLFLVQAGAAILTAVVVLLRGSRASFAAAAIVGLSSLAAVIVYRYIQVPAIGPLPSMYEPVWYTAKVITAVAEAAAGGLAILEYALVRKTRQKPRRRRMPASTPTPAE
ncbi:hypothetical protein [Arthrobacter sp. ISL-95]|uniref:hypothetical protein n=1 Tax=Arthrobacter sp. ISL-95 TaxID=2819116 RepID=UPI001BE9C1DB|nr:hypothetical protein [Arthrobacter sp. ISL-95]MBT2585613.1 hypothetical protein [Arthrobacter sp. ISL-95]